MVTVLFVADPAEKLKPAADSTLCFLREALRRGYAALWTEPRHLRFENGRIFAVARPVESCAPKELPKMGAAKDVAVGACTYVLLRKDPPFDEAFLRHAWLLSLEEPHTKFLNRPSLLVRYHEKLLPWEALASGDLETDDVVETYIGPRSGAQPWVARHGGDAVEKPFFGFGGKEIHRFDGQGTGPDFEMVQPFVPAIHTRGDRRVLYCRGEVIGSFARMPPAGSFVANLAQGGSAKKLPMTDRERATADRLGKFLAKAGFLFAGADLIGHQLTEVNVTSPTGIASLRELEGVDAAKAVFDAF